MAEDRLRRVAKSRTFWVIEDKQDVNWEGGDSDGRKVFATEAEGQQYLADRIEAARPKRRLTARQQKIIDAELAEQEFRTRVPK